MNYVPLTDLLEKDSELYLDYLILLSQLTKTVLLTKQQFMDYLSQILRMGYIFVCYTMIEDKIRIVGSGTLIIEPKLIRNGKCVGHIEDIIVDENYRSMKIASTIIKELVNKAKERCYKVILDCTEEVSELYEKNGFEKHGVQMSKYF